MFDGHSKVVLSHLSMLRVREANAKGLGNDMQMVVFGPSSNHVWI